MVNAVIIGIVGVTAGIVMVRVPILSRIIVQFILISIVSAYYILTSITALPSLPNPFLVFYYSAAITFFLIKILAFIPIPVVQDLAIAIGGEPQ